MKTSKCIKEAHGSTMLNITDVIRMCDKFLIWVYQKSDNKVIGYCDVCYHDDAFYCSVVDPHTSDDNECKMLTIPNEKFNDYIWRDTCAVYTSNGRPDVEMDSIQSTKQLVNAFWGSSLLSMKEVINLSKKFLIWIVKKSEDKAIGYCDVCYRDDAFFCTAVDPRTNRKLEYPGQFKIEVGEFSNYIWRDTSPNFSLLSKADEETLDKALLEDKADSVLEAVKKTLEQYGIKDFLFADNNQVYNNTLTSKFAADSVMNSLFDQMPSGTKESPDDSIVSIATLMMFFDDIVANVIENDRVFGLCKLNDSYWVKRSGHSYDYSIYYSENEDDFPIKLFSLKAKYRRIENWECCETEVTDNQNNRVVVVHSGTSVLSNQFLKISGWPSFISATRTRLSKYLEFKDTKTDYTEEEKPDTHTPTLREFRDDIMITISELEDINFKMELDYRDKKEHDENTDKRLLRAFNLMSILYDQMNVLSEMIGEPVSKRLAARIEEFNVDSFKTMMRRIASSTIRQELLRQADMILAEANKNVTLK